MSFTGKYLLDFQVPEIGDYLIDVSVEDDHLVIYDSNNNETNILTALEEMKFIDLASGDEVDIQVSEDTGETSIIFNNRFHFDKMEK